MIEHWVDKYPFEMENRIRFTNLTASESKNPPVVLLVAVRMVVGMKITLTRTKITIKLLGMLSCPPSFLPIVSKTLNVN